LFGLKRLDLEHKGAKRMAYLRHTSDLKFCSNFSSLLASFGLARLSSLCAQPNHTSPRGDANEVLECQ